MSRVAYVNGRYVPHGSAAVHVEDRGYQFADGVYEVVAVAGGQLVDAEGHMVRLKRSLSELAIAMPMSDAAMQIVMDEVIRRNRVDNGIIYLQVTRGVAKRDHPFPDRVRPAVVMTARRMAFDAVDRRAEAGIKVHTVPDIRWQRCDIKSISLLPNVLAKQAAREAGAYEAWQVAADGTVTEGSSTNAWIVDRDGNLVTRNVENAILNGITRLAVLELAREQGIKVVERAFTLEEAKSAREAFLTSTTSFVMPVVQIDDQVIGNGQPGSTSNALRELYRAYTEKHQ